MKKKLLCVLFALLLMLQPMSAFADTPEDEAEGEAEELVTDSIEIESTMEAFAGATKASKYNVVFVVDGSGSMEHSDAGNRRMDALRLFLGLATEEGNYVGTVVFNTDIAYESAVREYNSMAEKKALIEEVENVEAVGGTNIGMALYTAVTMLEESGNTSLPAVIVLLSDGNTYLSSQEEEAESERIREVAVQRCRDIGCEIFGVMLNADGDANISELMNISSATGGTANEVADADDLLDVYESFYELIYNAQSQSLLAEEVSDGDIIEKDFTIPAIGVEEVNILVDGDVGLSYVEITQPSGFAYTTDELETMTMSGDNFEIIKLPNPEAGEWKLQGIVDGDGEITIDLVMNRNLTITCDVVSGSSPVLNDNATVSMELSVDGERISDLASYPTYSAYVDVTCAGKTTSQEMILSGSSYTTSISLDQYGTFEIKPYLVESGMTFSGDTIALVVANRSPYLTKSARRSVTALSGIVTSFKKTIDLEKCFFDMEDAELSYTIESTEYEDGDSYIDGGELVLRNKGVLCSRDISIVAMDSQGGSVKWDLTVHCFSLLLLVIILLAVLAALALAAYKLAFSGGINAEIAIWENEEFDEVGHCFDRYGKGPVKYGDINWHGGGHFLSPSTMIFRFGKNMKLITNKTVYIGSAKYGAFSFVPLSTRGKTRLMLEQGQQDGKTIEIEISE